MEKKLYRVREGKVICGVCAGIAEYFKLDPVIVRLAAVLLTCAEPFSGLLVYIVAAIIVPEKPLEIHE